MTLYNSKCSMCGASLMTGDVDGLCIGCKQSGFGKTFEPFVPTYYAPWTCPRCGTVHAPWVSRCDCPPPSITTDGTQLKISFQ